MVLRVLTVTLIPIPTLIHLVQIVPQIVLMNKMKRELKIPTQQAEKVWRLIAKKRMKETRVLLILIDVDPANVLVGSAASAAVSMTLHLSVNCS